VEEIADVVNAVPVAMDEPPVLAVYQFMTPALAEAPKLSVPVPHLVSGDVLVIMGIVFTVAITEDLDADMHEPTVASTQ
jgi:hypothetical protein